MKMSSTGSSIAKNNIVTKKEGNVNSTESNYSLQTEQFCPKQNSRAKFINNKRSKRKGKIKMMRQNGNPKDIPKSLPKPHNGSLDVTNDSSDYVHQSLVEHLYPASLLDQARLTLESLNADASLSQLLEILEVVGALAVTLPSCTTPAQVAAQIVLSIRAMTKGSFTEAILRQSDTIEWCTSLFGFNIFEQQAGLPEDASWLNAIPSLRENWEGVRNAPLFDKISAMITVAASVGLCSVTNLNWSAKGVDLFRVGTINKHHTAIDLVGAVLDTIICFIEGGYECFRIGSFVPLLFTNDDSKELDALYFPLLELHEHAMVFNLHAKPVKIRGEVRTINDIEYSQLLEEALHLADRAYRSAKGTWQQGYLEKRREVLHRNRAAYQAKRIDGSMRFAPFTIYLWGDSGVGKSTVSQVMMSDCLQASGANPDPKGVAIIKESDKYDSTLKGDTVGIFFDDMGNTKVDFLDKAPTERIIDINNNMITYANKADLHEKGKVEIRPRVFVITSNAPLANHGRLGSIKPFSIIRRADIHIEVHVKKDYALPDKRLDSKKVLSDFPDSSLVNDVWDLHLYVPRDNAHGGNGNCLIGAHGKTDPHILGIREALKHVTSMCQEHFCNQRKLISKGEGLVLSRRYCKHCNLAHDICECITIDDKVVCELCQCIETEDGTSCCAKHYGNQASCEESFDFVRTQFESIGWKTNQFLALIPDWMISNYIIDHAYVFCHCQEFMRYECSARYTTVLSLLCIWFVTISLTMVSNVGAPIAHQLLALPPPDYWIATRPFEVALITHVCHALLQIFIVLVWEAVLAVMFYYSLLARWRDSKLIELARRRDLTSDLFKSIRHSKLVQFISFCIIAKGLYSLVMMFRGALAVQQSALAPSNVEEIAKRDSEENPWASAVAEELHVSDKALTMTHDQVLAKVRKNLCHGTFVENGFQQSCDLLGLGGNIFLLPFHLFKNRKDMRALITRKDPDQLNSTFRAMISVNYIVPIPGKDLCVASITSMGVFEDILHLFPEAITASGSATFLYKDAKGEISEDNIRLNYVKNSESGGSGFTYDLPYDTFTGLCMGVAVARYARNCIACVHLRGIPKTPKGKGLTVLKKELEDAIATAHKTWKGAFPSVSNGTFPLQRYEKQVLVSQDVHQKSPVNYMPRGSTIEFLGQGGTRITHTNSKVCVLPISDTVAQMTGVEREHGAPKFHRTRMWQASLAHSANPSAGIEGSLLEMAYSDYVNHLTAKFNEPEFEKWVRSELSPMTDMETLCGKDGKRFIDAVKKGTSKGFPLTGPKRDMIELLDPVDYPEFQCPAVADPMIIAEMRTMEDTLLSGERCYSIFKACVKDEPTKLDKEKVRVFQAADWATQLLVRKYYLPLARMLSLFPLDSECAVGVNAQGPEWDQLARFMRQFGSDRILAGDYSKYDLRMPAQLINAAFAALIEIADKCGRYSATDLKIMKGIATEIAYSCVAYNGDIIIHSGSNPSGHNLTVYINCIVNSLQLRCAYFHLWPNSSTPEPFRDNCAIMTYGDDVKGSVRPGYDWFNHISYANFLRERDMVFTMPDKESIPTEYMEDSDADFLKRHNIFNEDTGMIHGALDEASIFKSLHVVLESKVASFEDQCISNVDGALREWWQHGREVYETRRSQMNKVADVHEMLKSCKMLTKTYEDGLVRFRQIYLGDEEEIDESTFVSTVGDEWDIEE